MLRRNVIKGLTTAAGGGILLPTMMFSSCRHDDYEPIFFTDEEIQQVEVISETILPATADSPGAGEAKVANFIDLYVAECYDEKNQEIMVAGLASFDTKCVDEMGTRFADLSIEKRQQWLEKQSRVSAASQDKHYFSMLRQLVLFGYFTSRKGATQALRYLPVPGKYDGNYPYQEGDKTWALG